MSDLNHDHSFGQDRKLPGENRTLIVILITALMMVVEIVTGMLFGSMALLADGLHMASHTVALSITVFAYVYARRHSHDARYSFGTGKVNALGGFCGAILLAVFAVMMAVESVIRLANPVMIAFDQAIVVAVVGLMVNGICVLILNHRPESHHDHGPIHRPQTGYPDVAPFHDHNLRSAYLHVLADALTSFLAIFALLGAKYAGWVWMDPFMGIIGALLVSRWSIGLLLTTSHVLLDRQAAPELRQKVVESIEKMGDSRVVDLHFWAVGPGIYAVIVSLTTDRPNSPQYYKERIPSDLKLVHVTVEVTRT